MYINISDKTSLKKLQNKLINSFTKINSTSHIIRVGHMGGSWEEEVYYSDELNIWWLFKETSRGNKRYWNAFGVGNPTISNKNIIVEINYPKSGIDNRIGGCWAKDEVNNFYLFHSGKIAGGRKGIGKSTFVNGFSGEFCNVLANGKVKEKALVGVLHEKYFVCQIADFVHQVAVIKYPERYENFKVDTHKFSSEFDGKKIYNLPTTVTANGNHGLVVNALDMLLKQKKLHVGNNGATGRIDLFIYNARNSITHIFEVKTALSVQNVCTAIGQLMVYSYPLKSKPKKIFVCPEGIPQKIKLLLSTLNIDVLQFNFIKGKPIFTNIEQIL